MTMTSLINTLSIDIETFSSNDLSKCGVYKYVEANDFEILLFAYSVNQGDVEVVDLANGEEIPPHILNAIKDDKIIKFAFNATFERVCLSRYLGLKTGTYLNPNSWRCTMIWSAYLGLPLSLKGVGAVLKLDKQKLEEGKNLITYFTKPCNPTKANGGRTRNRLYHDRAKWDKFKKYNIRDVEVEVAIQQKLSKFPVPDFIWDEYHIDQEINDRGVFVDVVLVRSAIEIDTSIKNDLTKTMKSMTLLENPNSVAQVKMWLMKNGIEVETLGKKDVIKLKNEISDETIIDVLGLRQQLSKSSIKKYQAMKNAICSDGRVRGMFQFYGANRSGRFSGRLIQMQNLPQNHMLDLKEARELVKYKNFDALKMLYDDIPDVLSQLIRTAFISKDNMKFIVSDFSAIEARVIAWLSSESWRIDAFKNNEDIYCASASKMFGVPVEKHGINGHLRQKGKIAELALGYGGSVGALKSMGAIEMGLKEDELAPLVASWRKANPSIVKLWWDVDKIVRKVIKTKSSFTYKGLDFAYASGFLFITLPSGRKMAYVKPKLLEDNIGNESITYEGVGTAKKWERIESYGPKFVENIVQAISRDILVYAMKNLKNYDICMHIHDELVIEIEDEASVEEICKKMSEVPSWASGLVLNADGYETKFYKKD